MSTSPFPLQAWWATTRPKTLFAALAPVWIGGTLAWTHDGIQPWIWLATLFAALLIQIGTNFCNDLFDHRQGADTPNRQGPLRGLHTGQIRPRALAIATAVCFGGVALISLPLAARGGRVILLLAALSILCGIFYTAGRRSLAYTGMADGFVLLFFGPVAVAGTYYLQFPGEGLPPGPVWWMGLGPGLIATALLTVNNLRDVDEDRGNHKRTLAVRFGRSFARTEYSFCMLGALCAPLLAAGQAGRGWGVVALWLLLPLILPLIRRVWRGESGAELNPVLAATGRFLLLYALGFSLLWPWGG